jgi:hypothetical protein
MSHFSLDLAQSELKIVLEALADTDLEQKLSGICETSTDEDEIADIGNDLIEVIAAKANAGKSSG